MAIKSHRSVQGERNNDMKIWQEWVKEYQEHRLDFPRDPKWRFNNGELIKAIQLDAFKAGMTEAAEGIIHIACENQHRCCCTRIKKAILSARDQKTTL